MIVSVSYIVPFDIFLKTKFPCISWEYFGLAKLKIFIPQLSRWQHRKMASGGLKAFGIDPITFLICLAKSLSPVTVKPLLDIGVLRQNLALPKTRKLGVKSTWRLHENEMIIGMNVDIACPSFCIKDLRYYPVGSAFILF